MLAYFFPPDTNSGVPRTAKFIKYLDRLGWRTTVIAPEPRTEGRTDKDSGYTASIPASTEVHRKGVVGDNQSRIWNALHRLPLFWRVEDVVRTALEFPDEFATWTSHALPFARHVLERHRHVLIYSTSPPVTSHYIAMQLKKEFGLPWVADFRDPWTDDTLLYGNPPEWRRRVDLRLEHRIYNVADRIIANTPANREILIERHGVPPEKVITVTNGYDEEDFQGITAGPPADRFRIAYCGTFHSAYNPTAFLLALKKFLARVPDARIVLTLAGRSCEWAQQNIRDPQLLACLELLGQIPHRDVYELLAASHLLLHTYPQGIPYSVPGKLYEYLRSGRPVVAVCDRPSEVSRILEQTGRGEAFRPDETERIATFLQVAYSNWAEGGATPTLATDDRIRVYERTILTKRLAESFEEIVR